MQWITQIKSILIVIEKRRILINELLDGNDGEKLSYDIKDKLF